MSLHAQGSTASQVFKHFLFGKGYTIKSSYRTGFFDVWPGAHRGDVIWLLSAEEAQKLSELHNTQHWRCEEKENGRFCAEPARCIDTLRGIFLCEHHNAALVRELRREAGKLQAA